MENINQDAMMHGRRATYGSDTGGPLQIPNDRDTLQDEATEDSARMVSEGSDDSADDSPSLTTPNPDSVTGSGSSSADPLGKTNPEDSPFNK